MVYVAGHRHSRPPFCAVRTHHGLGFVPQYPLDRNGTPPINAKNGVFVLALRKNEVQAHFESAPTKPQLWESNWTKNFATSENFLATGAGATASPVIEGRMIHISSGSVAVASALREAREEPISMHYDYKTRNFVTPRNSVHSTGDIISSGVQNNVAPVVVAHTGAHGASGGADHAGGSSSGVSAGGGRYSSASSGGSGAEGHSGGGASSSSGSSAASAGTSASHH